MAYTIVDPILGAQPISEVSTTQRHPLGLIVNAVDETYGAGEFIYLSGVASTVLGSWVQYNADGWTTTLAVANDIGPKAIAMAACVASNYGWYQIEGKAIGKALTGYVDNALVWLTATAGSVDDAVVDGDMVHLAKGASAVDTPSAGLAEFEIHRPYTDDITTND